jgi:hypothetical protein
MKLEKLLELTNSKEFYQDNHLSIARIKTESDLYRNVVFDFIKESQIDTDRKKITFRNGESPHTDAKGFMICVPEIIHAFCSNNDLKKKNR